MRRFLEWIAPLIPLAVWGSWFVTLYWWSHHRPRAPSQALGLTHYVKTAWAVVYVGNLENDVNSGFQIAVIVATLLFFGAVFWLRRSARPTR